MTLSCNVERTAIFSLALFLLPQDATEAQIAAEGMLQVQGTRQGLYLRGKLRTRFPSPFPIGGIRSTHANACFL